METLYSLPIWETTTTSWQKVKGTKSTVWAVCLIMIAVCIAFAIVSTVLKHKLPFLNSILQVIGRIIIFLLEMGLLYIGIQRAFDLPISYKQAFHTFKVPIVIRLIGLYILQIIIFVPFAFLVIVPAALFFTVIQLASNSVWLNMLGFLCFFGGVLATIYLAIRLWLAMAFVLDKGAGPLKAIQFSFQASKGNFWNLLGIFLLQMIFFFISVVPFGMGLIWMVPFGLILYGLVYKSLLINVPNQIIQL